MRFFILISLLCSIAFSAPVLNGAEYTQIVTINHVQVAETSSDFLFQLKIPRVGALITAVESADDVGFTNVNDTTRRARWVVYTPDTIFMYSHIAVSSTVDTSYRLQYGKALNEVNSSATFTNCGITNFWGFDVDGSTAVDYADAQTGTITSPATIASGGGFGKGIQFDINANSKLTYTNDVIGVGDRTISFIITRGSASGTFQRLFFSGRNEITLNNTANANATFSSNGTATIASFVNAFPTVGEKYLASFVRNASTGIVTLYVNGSQVGTPQSGGEPVANATALNIGSLGGALPCNAKLDNIEFTSDLKTQANNTTKYNMLFNPSAFSTLSTIDLIAPTPNPHIDTLKLVCSAENALTYQWYDNNVAVSGATDSVYTIYADSTFYSIKHVIYCLVNGSVKYGNWVFQARTSTTSRWDSYKLFYKQAYKNTWK